MLYFSFPFCCYISWNTHHDPLCSTDTKQKKNPYKGHSSLKMSQWGSRLKWPSRMDQWRQGWNEGSEHLPKPRVHCVALPKRSDVAPFHPPTDAQGSQGWQRGGAKSKPIRGHCLGEARKAGPAEHVMTCHILQGNEKLPESGQTHQFHNNRI